MRFSLVARHMATRCVLSTIAAMAASILALPVSPYALAAARFKTLYSFCAQSGCADGQQPAAPLLGDGAGNLFGSTNQGGRSGDGTIFELTGDGKTLHTLYSFCGDDCSGPSTPVGNLVVDTNGALYGVANTGSDAYAGGVIFKLTPNADRTKWKLRILHTFCSTDCYDGSNPIAGLTYVGAADGTPYDGSSPLYGTTYGGSNLDYSGGAIYQFTPSSRGGKLKVLHSFCSQGACDDGANPDGRLILDAAGNIYGVAQSGGSQNGGAVFELRPKGKRYEESVLYDFDGTQKPYGTLIMDSTGQLYGTASDPDGGFVYKLAPDGSNSLETTLYHFCSESNCADGAYAWGGVVMDTAGVLYGSTFSGGSANGGAIFRLKGGSETVLHSFCAVSGCADGTNPAEGLIIDGSGRLVGTTENGGASPMGGTVFRLNR